MEQQAKTLSPFDALALIIGVVIGAGIFKTPSLVAAHSASTGAAVLFWLLGGFVSLAGALCYAELTTSFPDSGGDYHFIRKAFGDKPAFLFAWSRMTVIQTGSIAMLAFVIGDYCSAVFRLGGLSPTWYAALAIAVLTVVNMTGIRQGKRLQHLLSGGIVLGLAAVIIAGLSLPSSSEVAAPAFFSHPGKAMIFVLLTYGGWNEAAYLSAEIRHLERNMTRVLLSGIAIITTMYVAANAVFVKSLGLAGTARSETVAADLMRLAIGENGARFISVLIVLAAASALNAVMITGARSNYALGRDFRLFHVLADWRRGTEVPVHALLVQSLVALGLVGLGTLTRSGFSTMVEYTAPVFWFFFLLVGLSLFVLRKKEPERIRPFSVPFYPLTPLIFCLACAYMLQSSFQYAGTGTLAGMAVLVSGIPFFCMNVEKSRKKGGGQ